MNSAKNMIWLVLVVAIVAGVAGLLVVKRQMVKEAAPPAAAALPRQERAQSAVEAGPAAPPAEAPPAVAEASAPSMPALTPQSPPPAAPANGDTKRASRPAQAGPSGGAAKEPLQDPAAREALALVGVDPTAEAYWHAAINDPTLPANERQNLIEDLNEDGISDPKHPSPQDLPVILHRIQLIEVAGPYAMDQVNADAFQEAYKDLVNLADLAVGGGQPVR
jgi:hypothetical protein